MPKQNGPCEDASCEASAEGSGGDYYSMSDDSDILSNEFGDMEFSDMDAFDTIKRDTSSSGSSENPYTMLVVTDISEGRYTAWTTWSRCSRSCGGGERTRVRNCVSTRGCYNGVTNEKQNCSNNSC